jgi:hypothetical protein
MVVTGQIHALAPLTPYTHWIGGCMGSRDDLDAMEKRKILPLPEAEPRPSNPADLFRLSSFETVAFM